MEPRWEKVVKRPEKCSFDANEPNIFCIAALIKSRAEDSIMQIEHHYARLGYLELLPLQVLEESSVK